MTQLADFRAQLLTLTFPIIGCLVDDNGTVGPLGLSCTYPFMLKKNNRGPFASSKDFLLAHALPADQLVPTETFVLFRDDFNSGNILVSWSDPTEVVGILDWEGSRISPLWDPRGLCSVLNTRGAVEDSKEFHSLKELQEDILQRAQLYTVVATISSLP
ncbi:hypothetical protein B0H14DRAFT_2615483 [Mycena olivaceomarginata]|nr:hypothetical protein B0H14DRAFT_2615483 [Mycena olivaceomarginata]